MILAELFSEKYKHMCLTNQLYGMLVAKALNKGFVLCIHHYTCNAIYQVCVSDVLTYVKFGNLFINCDAKALNIIRNFKPPLLAT